MGKLGEGTGSVYPNNINEGLEAIGHPVDGKHPNDLVDAVVKIETELGSTPKGTYTDLGERIEKLIQDFLIPNEIPSGLINGTNKTFTTANKYIGGTLKVRLNGIIEENDITEVDDETFEWINAPVSGDTLRIEYIKKP